MENRQVLQQPTAGSWVYKHAVFQSVAPFLTHIPGSWISLTYSYWSSLIHFVSEAFPCCLFFLVLYFLLLVSFCFSFIP